MTRRLLTNEEGKSLVRLARHTLESHLRARSSSVPEPVIDAAPTSVGGVFATLKCDGDLRGCIGVLSDTDLVQITKSAVIGAASNDPRFTSVTLEELPRIRINITVLAPPVLLGDVEEIQIGRDGLVVERAGARGLLLPQVAQERGWDRERFLSETCVKAGLSGESWREPDTIVLRFAAMQFDEE